MTVGMLELSAVPRLVVISLICLAPMLDSSAYWIGLAPMLDSSAYLQSLSLSLPYLKSNAAESRDPMTELCCLLFETMGLNLNRFATLQ